MCEAVEESTNISKVSWDRQNLMTRGVYMKIIDDIVTERELRQAVLCVQKFNRDLSMLQPHTKKNMYTGGTKHHEQISTLGQE